MKKNQSNIPVQTETTFRSRQISSAVCRAPDLHTEHKRRGSILTTQPTTTNTKYEPTRLRTVDDNIIESHYVYKTSDGISDTESMKKLSFPVLFPQ